MLHYKTQILNFNEDVVNLLCQIDTKLAQKAKQKFDSERFGSEICLNMDDYELLVKYKKILYDKAKNSCCLKQYLIDDIISRIKQLLNRN